MTTDMPCLTHNRVTARPTPDPAPVINALAPFLKTDIFYVGALRFSRIREIELVWSCGVKRQDVRLTGSWKYDVAFSQHTSQPRFLSHNDALSTDQHAFDPVACSEQCRCVREYSMVSTPHTS